jgi:hypothetical protein
MSDVATLTKCEKGHRAERTISAFAMARGGAGEFMMEESAGGGGCCGGGGGCACSN